MILLVVLVSFLGCNEPAATTPLPSLDMAPDLEQPDTGSDARHPELDGLLRDGSVPTPDVDVSAVDVGASADATVQGPDVIQTMDDFGVVDLGAVDAEPLSPVEGLPCPGGWAAVPLELNEQGEWSAVGTTEGAESRTEGSCGGGSGQDIFQFTSPAEGTYAITLVGETFAQLGFAVIYARTSCPEVDSEIACDARREPNARFMVRLAAQQQIYLFVDGLRSGGFPSTGGYRLRVFQPDMAMIQQVAAWMNPQNGSTSIDVTGVVGTAAVNGIEYRFLDAQGEPVAARGSVNPLRFGLVFDTRPEADGRTHFSGTLDFASDVMPARRDAVTHLEIAVYDALGAVSDPRRTRIQMPSQLGVGDRCDMVSARTMCPPETECFIQDPLVDPNPACHPMGVACPGEWTVIDLNASQVAGGHWAYDGSLLRGNPPLEQHGRGTCPGATGRNDLFRFVAPEARPYTFETSGEIGDTIMWIRRACGIIGPAAELGCNDDTPGLGRFSQLVADLDAGQTVYVFVDSFGANERGPYSLNVRAQ